MTKPMTLKEFQSRGFASECIAGIEAALKHREELMNMCLRLKTIKVLDISHVRIIEEITDMVEKEKTAVQLAAEKGFEGT